MTSETRPRRPGPELPGGAGLAPAEAEADPAVEEAGGQEAGRVLDGG